ncbi:MAG: T9SS type A sorting domain-containing protein [Bacteroidales bacterium]|nr:T9SS type A sorting domain-containing protein [Bacteroidales bacterium]
MKRFTLMLFVTLIGFHLPATNTFEKSYGGSWVDEGFAVRQTTDEGYIIVGYTYSFGPGPAIYLIRTDPAGDTLWTKQYFNLGSGYGMGRDVIEDDDGGFVICGVLSGDLLLLKVDQQGVFSWQKTFGGIDEEEGYSLQKTTDHGFILCGYTRSLGTQFESVYWIKTDSLGNLQWQNTYSGLTVSRGLCVRQTFDGNYIICGYTGVITDNVVTDPGSLIVKINQNGDTLWAKSYPGMTAQTLVETNDHGYLVCFNNQGPYSNVGLLRTDQNGSSIWMKEITVANTWNEGRWIEKTYDGNFIIGGVCDSGYPLIWNLLLLKINDSGDTLWTRRYPGVLSAVGNCVQPTGDQGYVICGYTSAGPGQQDVYLVKTDENGIITGMDDPVETREFCFYPNPAANRLTFRFAGALPERDTKITLYDLFGKPVAEEVLLPGHTEITMDTRNLSPGIYFYRVVENNRRQNGKILIIK